MCSGQRSSERKAYEKQNKFKQKKLFSLCVVFIVYDLIEKAYKYAWLVHTKYSNRLRLIVFDFMEWIEDRPYPYNHFYTQITYFRKCTKFALAFVFALLLAAAAALFCFRRCPFISKWISPNFNMRSEKRIDSIFKHAPLTTKHISIKTTFSPVFPMAIHILVLHMHMSMSLRDYVCRF